MCLNHHTSLQAAINNSQDVCIPLELFFKSFFQTQKIKIIIDVSVFIISSAGNKIRIR